MTTRAALLAVVVCVLALALTVPLRQFLAQRGRVAQLRAQAAAQQRQVDALEARAKQLQDPRYIEQLARERLHFVRPGEVPYIVLAPSPAPSPHSGSTAGAAASPAQGPWYSQLYGTLRTAGQPPARRPHR